MTSNPASIPTASYDAGAQFLHWSMAALITLAFVLGLTIDAFPSGWKAGAIEAHKAIGLALILLLATRLTWRLTHRPPPLEPAPRLMTAAAHLGHAALYGLMLLAPVIGLVYAIKRGQGLDLGLFSIPPFAAPAPRAETRPIREWHEWAAYALMLLAGVHALAALWHHLIRKDGTLRRMLPR
ncbi:cytochrome b [Bosea sp. BH3]|uniref:cytochrome b n=1 Tax=Bosea sp. BH3 TaxID=2871701 RepID=UPI0021CB7C57|nr:cytochrome b/b6 domain-containing protein [Bosea sp. BH3]MCU4181971.1 cytochrome b/b6 domain-containing protein [Bosea sp. BH3]